MYKLTNRVSSRGCFMDRIDDTEKIIDQFVSLEWDMFQAVNEGGPRASCQEDRATFEGMRRGQFLAWSPEARAAYLEDLLNAELDGRNLVREKYIHMMKNVVPAQYALLAETIPMPEPAVMKLAGEISDRLLAQTQTLFDRYPHVTGAGRPLRASSDTPYVTSIETYQYSELLTYSEATLSALKAHLEALEKEGRLLAREILEKTVRHYGYQTLEAAENAAKTRGMRP
jgi:hypothetical protein